MYYKMIVNPMMDTFVSGDPELPHDFDLTDGDFVDFDSVKPFLPLEFPVESYDVLMPLDYHKSLIPVMSKRFVDALYRVGMDNIQAFPAELVDPESGRKWTDYYAVNILGKVYCADMENSKYEHIGAGVIDFDELILDYSKTRGLSLFRLAEQPSTIVIHGKIIDELKKIDNPKFKGVSFRYLKDRSEVTDKAG